MDNTENRSIGQNIANEGERFGKRVAESIGSAADAAGQRIDAAVDYVDNTSQNVRESLNQIRDEGWEGLKRRALDYTRNSPVNALLIAVCAGMFLGWLTKRR